MLECRVDDRKSGAVGTILTARVENLVPSIHAAFLSAGGKKYFLPVSETLPPFFTAQAREGRLTVGDELLVQITSEEQKGKNPVVRESLEADGRYCVVLAPGKRLHFSRKIADDAWEERMREALAPVLPEGFDVIVRTNAYAADPARVAEEVQALSEELTRIIREARSRCAGTVLRQAPADYLREIRDLPAVGSSELVTDSEELAGEIRAELARYPETAQMPVRLYRDAVLPLEKLYRIPILLQRAVEPVVWLSSGAWIRIEPTEALTAVDVNTGKASAGKKDREDFFLSVNLEAARELMLQIRLRALSGMIIVDFISMKKKESADRLMEQLRALAAGDPGMPDVVDMTSLGLVEITRKKVREPLTEQLRSLSGWHKN